MKHLKKSTLSDLLKYQENSLLIRVEDIRMATPEIVKVIVEAGGLVFGVSTFRASLEEAYLKLINGEEL